MCFCVLGSARRVECREGISGSAGIFVGAAESGEDQQVGGQHHLSTDRKTDAAGQGGMFCSHLLFSKIYLYSVVLCRIFVLHMSYCATH